MNLETYKDNDKYTTIDGVEIWVDTETGVNYMFKSAGYAGGIMSSAIDGIKCANQVAQSMLN